MDDFNLKLQQNNEKYSLLEQKLISSNSEIIILESKIRDLSKACED